MPKTWIEIAQEVFPDRDDNFLQYVMWNKTGYPCFFAPKEGQTIEDVFKEQLIEFRDSCKSVEGA